VTAFDPDVETEFIAGQSIDSVRPSVSRGLLGFAESWRDWLEPWDSYYIEAERFIDLGEEVVSLTRVRARTTRDAVAVEHRPGAVWSLRDRKIVRVRFYLHREEALEAVGLQD
jgi:ketosteroid isomerase-like protein